jgi:GNAT superfamily N-acetyltransferase
VKSLETFLASGDFAKHKHRLQAQEEGKGQYLVAWYLIPVGHIYIVWDGCDEGPLAGRQQREPFIEDTYVHPAARRKGIGTLLMDAAEQVIWKHGHHRVGLTVSINNPQVEAMYEKRGYEEAGLGVFESRRMITDSAGRERIWSAKVRYWVKDLSGRDHGHNDS